MLKTMKKPNAPREGRGVPLQRQNPKKTFSLVSLLSLHYSGITVRLTKIKSLSDFLN